MMYGDKERIVKTVPLLLEREQIAELPKESQKKLPAGKMLIYAAFAAAGVYMSQLLRLLKRPLFSRVYYGNLNDTFFYFFAAVLLFMWIFALRAYLRRKYGISIANRPQNSMKLWQRAVLYLMTAIPVLLTAISLNYRFKITYELGERITGMTLLGNATCYIYAAAKLFAAVTFIALVHYWFENRFKRAYLPVASIAAALVFGLFEVLFCRSAFTALYIILYAYMGIMYIVSGKRIGAVYAAGLIIYML